MPLTFSSADLAALRRAVQLLEHPGLFIQAIDTVGKPIEYVMKKLPERARLAVQKATRKALEKALHLAIGSLGSRHAKAAKERTHFVAVSATGAVGGLFGWLGLAIELPVSTALMLRGIADVARSEGENLGDIRGKLACMEVFAMGGRTQADDPAESAYFLARAAITREITQAADILAERGMADKGAPVLIRLIVRLADRFGVQVSEKAAAQFIPALGAIGGGTLNAAFMHHFLHMARGHFIVRRLERTYGEEATRVVYEACRSGREV